MADTPTAANIKALVSLLAPGFIIMSLRSRGIFAMSKSSRPAAPRSSLRVTVRRPRAFTAPRRCRAVTGRRPVSHGAPPSGGSGGRVDRLSAPTTLMYELGCVALRHGGGRADPAGALGDEALERDRIRLKPPPLTRSSPRKRGPRFWRRFAADGGAGRCKTPCTLHTQKAWVSAFAGMSGIESGRDQPGTVTLWAPVSLRLEREGSGWGSLQPPRPIRTRPPP